MGLHNNYAAGHSLTSSYGWSQKVAPEDRGFTILEAIDSITDEQMLALSRVAILECETTLAELHTNLIRIRKAAKNRFKGND